MKHMGKILMIAVCVMFTATTLVSAIEPRVQYIKLWEKDPVTWMIVPNGAYGEAWVSQDYHQVIFRGYKLNPETAYTLLSYHEPWSGFGSIIIGTGYTNRGGGLQIVGAVASLVYNVYTTGEYAGQTGAKIWLVLSSDFQNGKFVAWNPTEYLFETHLIYP